MRSGLSKCGTNLHATRRICKSSCKIMNALPNEMFKCCASSLTVILQSSRIIMTTIFPKTFLRAVLSCPYRGLSITLFQTHCTSGKTSAYSLSQCACCNTSLLSLAVFPNFTQNFKAYCCSRFSCIFFKGKKQEATLLYDSGK